MLNALVLFDNYNPMKRCLRKEVDNIGPSYAFINYVIVAASVILSSCVTAPLKTEKSRERLAEAMGFEPNEIDIMGYCFFEEIRDSESEMHLKGHRGIVAMTESELCLVDGKLGKAPKDHYLRIPLSQIKGVSSSNGLIQIKHQDRLIVLFLYHWNDLVADHELSQELYQSLILANVPGFETDEHYSFNRFQAPPKLVPYNEREEPHDPYQFPDQYPHEIKNR